MSKLLITIDGETREMTDTELAEYQAFCEEVKAVKAAEAAEIAAKETARAALFERLGITTDEAALLLS